MLVTAAVCPGPPLLIPELSGADPVAADLRAACLDAVRLMLTRAPDVVAVIGPGERTGPCSAHARVDVSVYKGGGRASAAAPLSVGLGGLLLDWAGYQGERRVWSVERPDGVAAQVLAAAPTVAILVVSDGSARRTLTAPGFLDERSGPYDAAVSRAVSTGNLATLAELDEHLARALMATGWPALQVLAAVAGAARPRTTVHFDDAPYGVGYLVASMDFVGTASQ